MTSKSKSGPRVKKPDEGRLRVVIENVRPQIDGGRFPAKRVVGERVTVEADIFADGHDVLSAVLLYRKEGDSPWSEIPMEPLVNDRWRGAFEVIELGACRYTLQAWPDRFATWRQGLGKKVEAGQDVAIDLLSGAELVQQATKRALTTDKKQLQEFVSLLRSKRAAASEGALSAELAALMSKYPDRRGAVLYDKELTVSVDREKTR